MDNMEKLRCVLPKSDGKDETKEELIVSESDAAESKEELIVSESDAAESKEESEESMGKISRSDEEFEKVELESFYSKYEDKKESEEKKEQRKGNKKRVNHAEIQRKCELKLLDTLKCKDFLNKFVKIITADGKSHFGLLKYLDPMTGDMIIVDVRDEIENTLIFQETCVSVTPLDKHNSEHCAVLPFLDVERRRNHLISWIKHNKLPIYQDKDGSLLFSDNVTIKAPYEPDDCICDDPLMLQRAKELVRNIPFYRLSIEDQIKSELNKEKLIRSPFPPNK